MTKKWFHVLGFIGFVIQFAGLLILGGVLLLSKWNLITQYPVIFNFRVGTRRVLEKKFGTGRVPGSRRTLVRGVTACLGVLGHFFAKWAISCFIGRSEGLPGWFAHFLDQFGDVKKKFKLCSNWIEVKMIGASWRHFVPEPFWPLWNRPDVESAPISSFSNRCLQSSRWEPTVRTT